MGLLWRGERGAGRWRTEVRRYNINCDEPALRSQLRGLAVQSFLDL